MFPSGFRPAPFIAIKDIPMFYFDTPLPHVNNTNYLVSLLDLEPLAIPYQANQPVDPQLWDRNSNLISLFGTDKFLAGNTKNIVCSIQRIAIFIK